MELATLSRDTIQHAIDRDGITLIDFWAPWCGPCRAFGPIFERAAERHADLHFAKLNTEDEQELAARFGIESIPTLLIFRDKIPVYFQPGALPERSLEELISKVQALDMDAVRAQLASESDTGLA